MSARSAPRRRAARFRSRGSTTRSSARAREGALLPFYYSVASSQAISASANTDFDVLRYLTVNTAGTARAAAISRLILGNTGAAAQDNQIYAYLNRMSTGSSAGGAITPNPHDFSAPAATVTAFTAPTAGTKLVAGAALNLGFNSRAMVQWVALNPDEAILLNAGGGTGAGANLDLFAQEAAGTAFTLRYNVTHYE